MTCPFPSYKELAYFIFKKLTPLLTDLIRFPAGNG